MNLPVWFKTVLAGVVVSLFGWAATDRLSLGERITKLEAAFGFISDSIKDVKEQNKRIEYKLDRELEMHSVSKR